MQFIACRLAPPLPAIYSVPMLHSTTEIIMGNSRYKHTHVLAVRISLLRTASASDVR